MVLDSRPTVFDCGWCKEQTGSNIILSDKVVTQIVSLCKKFENKEWGAVFTVKDGRVDELRIPKQKVSGASVEFSEELGGNGCIHSHNNMNAFWSGTDNETFRDRYEYSIVVNNKMEFKACHRVKLPCGGFGYKEIAVQWGTYQIPEDKFQDPTPTVDHMGWMSHSRCVPITTPTTQPVSRVSLPDYDADDEVFDKVTASSKRKSRPRETEVWEHQEMVSEAMAEVCDNCESRSCDICKVKELVDRLEERIWTDYLY